MSDTYLPIDIAVEGIPPALMCAVRFLIAGVSMLAFCGLRGRNIRYSLRQLGQMATVGVLLLMGGNLTLSYSEQHIGSGLAALTTTTSFGREQLWASINLVGGSFSWALGSVLAKRWKSADVDPFSATAWQMIAAGLANLLFAIAAGDFSRVVWTPREIGATLYLVVCGSWIGYTAYIWLLNHVPTAKVSTYAYVNPVVAVFLGWLVLSEHVDRYILAGSAIVVASVILVTSAQVTKKPAVDKIAMAETTGD